MVTVANMEAQLHAGGHQVSIDYTNGGASVIDAGTVLRLGLLAYTGVANTDLEVSATKQQAVSVAGHFRVKKASATVFAQGDPVEWDDTGKLAVVALGGDWDIGYAVQPGADGDDYVIVELNGVLPT
jgi:predicted RecA/RadA family phage recombinase